MLIPKRKSVIATANEAVSIFLVCDWIGMYVPEAAAGSSVKVRCPFGEFYHPDQGAEAAFRVYRDSNTAWCFACGQFFTPVSLAAAEWGRDADEVAAELLDRIGHRPVEPALAWQAAVSYVPEIDKDSLGQALKLYAERIDPGWMDHQFDQQVQGALGKCLALLNAVRSGSDAVKWLSVCKQVMARELEKVGVGGGSTEA